MSPEAGAAIILAADVGGTKTRFGLFRRLGGRLEAQRLETVPSDRTRPFADVLGRFLGTDVPRAACFAAAIGTFRITHFTSGIAGGLTLRVR